MDKLKNYLTDFKNYFTYRKLHYQRVTRVVFYFQNELEIPMKIAIM